MMHREPSPAIRIAAMIGLLLLAPMAEAYLDPSTGSLILSAIIGLFATIGLAIKTWWYKIKTLFRRGAPPSDNDGPAGR